MSEMKFLILNEKHEVTPIEDAIEWGEWYADFSNRKVAQSTWSKPGIFLSTVFLGIDHSYGQGPPLLFETMAFKTEPFETFREELYCERYATWEQAETGHWNLVKHIIEEYGQPDEQDKPPTS